MNLNGREAEQKRYRSCLHIPPFPMSIQYFLLGDLKVNELFVLERTVQNWKYIILKHILFKKYVFKDYISFNK